METFDPTPNSPPLPQEMLRKLLAIDLDTHFGLLVQAYHNEVRVIVRQLTATIQLEQSVATDALAQEIFAQMYGDLKSLKAYEILELPLWARLYRITVDRCFGRLIKKYETQIYDTVQLLFDKSKLEQSEEVLALAETIFSQARQDLKNSDVQAIQTPQVWDWLLNFVIAHCFEQLIETYRPQLEIFVLKLSGSVDNVQDIVQDALLNAFRSLKEHGMPDKKDTFDPKGWIFQIARRVFLKSLRKTLLPGKEISISQASEDHPIFEIEDDRNVPPDVVLELKESQERVRELVERLPEAYRAIIKLRLFDDLGNAEIATHLTMKEATVRSYIHRGLKLLREHLRNA